METGSDTGVASAPIREIRNTAGRQPFRMLLPLRTPTAFRSTRMAGSTNAKPNTNKTLTVKRTYSDALITLELPSGVKPNRDLTKPGNSHQPK